MAAGALPNGIVPVFKRVKTQAFSQAPSSRAEFEVVDGSCTHGSGPLWMGYEVDAVASCGWEKCLFSMHAVSGALDTLSEVPALLGGLLHLQRKSQRFSANDVHVLGEGKGCSAASWEVNSWCVQVVDDVCALGALAANMRRRRFASGALRLDNVKLVFRLGADGNPAAAEPHVQREANQLVEVRAFPKRGL